MTIECDIYGLRPPSASSLIPEIAAGPERRHACAHCGSRAILRDLRRRGLERWVLAVVGQRPYRCLDCGHRFFDRPLAVRVVHAVAGAPRPWPTIGG